MRRFLAALFLVAFTPVATLLLGCASSSTEEATSTPAGDTVQATQPADEHEGEMPAMAHEGHEHEGEMQSMAHEGDTQVMAGMEGLKELSESDRASAMKQHMCPVSGKMLGSMGKPIKVTAKGQELWLCCQGCQGSLDADPDKYLAKLQ